MRGMRGGTGAARSNRSNQILVSVFEENSDQRSYSREPCVSDAVLAAPTTEHVLHVLKEADTLLRGADTHAPRTAPSWSPQRLASLEGFVNFALPDRKRNQ